MVRRTAFCLLACLLSFSSTGRASNGYHALISCGEGFLAAGSGGRLDWISASGTLSKSLQPTEADLNALLVYQNMLFVAGDRGTLLISSDERSFRNVEVGTDASIFCLASFHQQILAGCEQGLLLVGDQQGVFKQQTLSLEGNIVSLSASETACYGVTDKGEIIHSTDGTHWEVFDFNTNYAGYYKQCQFTCIFAADNQIAVAGKYVDGTPVLMLSTQGTVWSERPLTYVDDQGSLSNLTTIPTTIFLDKAKDQWLLACGNGQLMSIPACSHCHRLIPISTEDLTGICRNGDAYLIVGANFSRHVMNAD